MDCRKMKDTWYVRVDKGEEIISTLLDLCRREQIGSAVFTGIGGCSSAQLQTFLPETQAFETETIEGMLELINITGNIVSDENDQLFHHTHAVYSFKHGKEHKMAAGHIRATTVLYTAEIELRPVYDGVIRRKYDPETGTGFWDFTDRKTEENGMKEYIAYCGLDCETCEAHIATINNDHELREKVAKHWSELNGVEITPAMINCDGCRLSGAKTVYCDQLCPIRQCALGRNVETCGNCAEMETCEKLGAIISNNADALQNLQQMKK